MEQTKINYPIPTKFEMNSNPENSPQIIAKSVVASLCGALIPAVIFYFLM